jgi:putrescine aminotransferase
VQMESTTTPHLFSWEECAEFSIYETKNLYGLHVSKSQADMIGMFGFGRTTATHAEGMYISTSDDRKILDFTGGIGVLNHGHNHPRILAARKKYQEAKRMEVHKNFLSPYVAGLSHNLAQLLPEDLNVVYFCNSGAEAVEGAMKMAYKFHAGNRSKILHSDISFHGKLLGAASVTASPELHFNFPQIPGTESFKYGDIESVHEQIQANRTSAGESDVYALIIEPFSASSLVGCSDDFLKELRMICDAEGVVLIYDEVYTSWAKTGPLFYFFKSGVVPDIVTTSKSFGGGKASISAYVARDRIFRKAYDNKRDATLHSTTYNALGEECVTAIEAINIVVEDDYVGRSQRIEKRLGSGLRELKEKHGSFISDVRGSGALWGVVLNPAVGGALSSVLTPVVSKLAGDEQIVHKLVTAAVISHLYNEHSILTFFGSNRDLVLVISPSLIVTDEEIDQFIEALDRTLSIGKTRLVAELVKGKFFG